MATRLRTLTRTSKGWDVADFQKNLNKRLDHIPGGQRYKLKADGVFGKQTYLAWLFVKPYMGFLAKQRPTPRAQRNVRDHRTRSRAAVARARAYRARPREASRPHEVIVTSVVCQSSRGGVTPRLIVLHTTEGFNKPGKADLEGLAEYFDRLSTQASSHVGVDGEGLAAQFVPDDRKAWTQAAFNPQSLSIEQIGFSSQKSFPEAQLRTVAQYIAFWSKKYSIPIKHSTSNGVCEHKDLGQEGGGHDDCGPNYPFNRVLAMARSMV